MLVPKKNRLAVYAYLFKEGVLVCKKDQFAPKHMVLEVPNLHVMKLAQSLKSRGFVTEKFNWRYFYYILTDTGIAYLRDYLHIPAEVVPDTLKKSNRPQTRPSFRALADGDERRGGRGRGRGRGGFGGFKKDGPTGDFNPEFQGQQGDESGYRRGRGGFRGGRGRGGFRGGRGRGGRGGFGGDAAAAGAPPAGDQ